MNTLHTHYGFNRVFGAYWYSGWVLQNENVYIGLNNEGFNLVGVHDIMGYRMGQFGT